MSELVFAKATLDDLPGIVAIYDAIHTLEEKGPAQIGWKREIYPTENSARESIEAGDMFVAYAKADCPGTENKIVASARINREQVQPTYSQVPWKFEADDEQVMVLHTLVVDPKYYGQKIGPKFVEFYEDYARQAGCTVLRIDTNKINSRARKMYAGLGYREAAILPCEFNGIPGVELVCLEKKL